MSALSFSFENNPITVIMKDGEPWFVASEITKVINLSNPTVALRSLRDAERAKININGRETNVVRESGLYTLILRSQDAIKEGTAAFRFRVKVTDEILPAIRRTGRYECPAQPQYLTDQQCWAIQSAVGKRARGQGAHFQTIYRALKARFQVPTYTRILSKDFEAAIEFIQTCELRAPVRQETAPQLTKQDDLCPHCGLRPIPHDSIVLSSSEAESLLTFIYYVRFLFRDANDLVYQLLRAVNSPMAGKFWDALHEVNWGRMLDTLARHGHDIRDMKCYQHFISDRA